MTLAAREYANEHKLIADEFLEELIVLSEACSQFRAIHAGPGVAGRAAGLVQADHEKACAGPASGSLCIRSTGARGDIRRALERNAEGNASAGKIHGYYTIYWGEKIIEWSRAYEEALRAMIDLHDIYALDGKDPNTYTNILWCFGLHDRPWAERPVFGQLRYMSLEGRRRKTDVDAYIKEIAALERTGKDPFRI